MPFNDDEHMTKDEFLELLRRYRSGECSPEEVQKIDRWFDVISNDNLQLNDLEKAEMNARMLSTLGKTLPSRGAQGKTIRIRPRNFPLLQVAASLIAVMLVIYVLIKPAPVTRSSEVSHNLSPAHLTKHKNSSQDILKIQLPDSSTVELKPNAEVAYAEKWESDKREVHLIGEAFFEVVKDSARPFYVYGGEVVTKVLGTSFSVKAEQNAESIEVAVRTGKVSVYKDAVQNNTAGRVADASGVVLTPNEKVEYFINDKHWVTSLVETPAPLPASNKALDMVFSGTPMSEIISRIERTYSIGVIIENEASNSCTFTGDVSMMELYDMLDVICKSTGTNYEVKGTKILITGRGCE